MSIIQSIRDKYARVAVIAIAVALIGFILTDYLVGKGRGAFKSGNSNMIGSVNGKKIDIEEFKKKVDQVEANYKQQGYPQNAGLTQQAVEQTWNQEVTRILFENEFNKLGMQIGKREKGDILYGPHAPDVIKKAGTDDKGNYDPVRAKQQVDQMMKNKQVPQQQKDDFNNFIVELAQQRMSEKYMSLFSNSTNYPRWFVEKQTADNTLLGKISMVRQNYTDSMFVDSTIKISDKEIADYISKHKDDYKQDESRSINYVTFSAAPTAGDSADAKKQVTVLKPEFDTTKEVNTFLLRNGSSEPADVFIGAAQLPPVAKDSIIKLSKNRVYGPYLDGESYVFAKLLDSKNLPDSAKARHILIQTYIPQQNQQILDDGIAKKRIDSIDAAIKKGASFDSLAIKFSDDKGSGAKGGLLSNARNPATNYFSPVDMVKEFNDFCFEGKTGEKKIVKTTFGYHLIEILDQKNFGPHYKMAYLSKDISVSQQTDNDALNAANAFFGDSKDQKSFDESFEKTIKPKKGIKGIATNIKPADAQINGVGLSRSFVKNIFAAKQGEVLKPEKVNNEYVVAIVTEVNEEGTQSVAKARMSIEPVLRNKKKGEMIKQKIGKVTTLEAAATALNKKIETVDSLRINSSTRSSGLGFEPKVNGATFNPANKGKVVSEALEGVNGVYVIRVENVSATASTEGSVADQRKTMYERGKQSSGNPIEALKKAAAIKDKRAERY